ncbi:MAG: peptide chain release factor N(5)-glutamine methyltransferase [Pseudomonadota bacterium]
MTPATVGGLLGWASAELAGAGIGNGARDARLIMAATLSVAPERITLMTYDAIDAASEAAFMASIQLRAQGHPVSHLVGGRLFYDRWFRVTPDVLDPRPETEELIAEALRETFADVLDLGAGSGAIILTLLAERTEAVGMATDISEAALRVATENAATLGVDRRVHFEVSDWFTEVRGEHDLIVSNPPYIAATEMDDLQPEVRLYEPRIALTDEADGLTAYRKITAGAPDHLRPGGRLIVEIGPTQAAAVSAMFESAGLTEIRVTQDLDGRDRVVSGRKPLN